MGKPLRRRFYVYELIDPRDGAVFYVGKGCGARVDEHEREARRGVDHPKNDRIRDIWAAGRQVEKRIVQTFGTEAAAFRRERKLIAQYGQDALCNIHSGGPIQFAPKSEAKHDADKLRALFVVGVKTDMFRASCARWWYAGEWHILPREAIEAFGRIFMGLVEKRGADWASSALRAA